MLDCSLLACLSDAGLPEPGHSRTLIDFDEIQSRFVQAGGRRSIWPRPLKQKYIIVFSKSSIWCSPCSGSVGKPCFESTFALSGSEGSPRRVGLGMESCRRCAFMV